MTSLEMTPPPETLEDRAAEELASLVEDVYLIGKACKDYYADSLAFEKKTETFKQYLAENRETVLKLKDKFPTGFHNTRILIRTKMMTWAEFVQDCFGVSYQYIEKLLKQPTTVIVSGGEKNPGPTEKELLKAKVVELSSKVEELSAELEAKAAPTTSSEDDKPPAKILTAGINLPPQTTESEYDEEPTFDDVVHYFESLDDDEQVQQIHKLCNELGLEFESSNL